MSPIAGGRVVVRVLLRQADEDGRDRGAADRPETADDDDDEREDQQARSLLGADDVEVDAAEHPRRSRATPPIAKTSVNALRTSMPSACTIARFSTPAG
jgi:hypothetical protein